VTAKRSALIVATSEYKDPRLATLEGPGHDADALRTVLANKEIGGFDVRLALNSRVDTLRRTLETFFADRARDDLLLVHFSGHGLKDDDGQLYLAAADTQLDRLLSTGIDAVWVNRLMNRCRSERIALFLDCCFAGAFTRGMARRVGADTAGVKEQFTGSGLFVITASDAMQYSFEGGQQVGQPPEPSPFTKALVDGLLSGEADRNEDGEVSINELFDFLEDRIRETSPSQTPTKSAFNQVGDWVIARSTRLPSVRLLPEGLQAQLKSDNPLDRIGALIDLRDLIEGPERRIAGAAMQALQRLAADDSRRVAATAQRLLEEEGSKPRKATRAARHPAIKVVAEAASATLQAEPIKRQATIKTPKPVERPAATNADTAMPPVHPEPASRPPASVAPTAPPVLASQAPAGLVEAEPSHRPSMVPSHPAGGKFRAPALVQGAPVAVGAEPPSPPVRGRLMSLGRWARSLKRPVSPMVRVGATATLAIVTILAFVGIATQLPNRPTVAIGRASGGGPPTAMTTAVPAANTTVRPPEVAPDMLVATSELRAGADQVGAGGNRLVDLNGRFTMLIRNGGDVAVVDGFQRVLWHSGTKGADHITMQDDGNLVVYSSAGLGLWDTGARGHGAYWLVLQVDGNLVLHPPGSPTALWNSQSDGGCVGSWCGACLYHCSQSMVEPHTWPATGEFATRRSRAVVLKDVGRQPSHSEAFSGDFPQVT
jgi:uncharacterized caspase-like protein